MKIDSLRYIKAVTREVRGRDYEGRPARIVGVIYVYDTTIENVWNAITDAERIPRWFLPISGDLRLGGRYQLHGNAGGRITGCEPPLDLALTWEFGGEVSWVQVRLAESADGGTRLELEHIAHVPGEFWNQYGPGAVGVGWDLAIMGLDRYLSTGASLDQQQAAAWPATDEGKDFVSRSSEEWCQASIFFGTDEAAARSAATRTTAFYSGGE